MEMNEFLDEQPGELEEHDEHLVRRLNEKVTVFEEKLTDEFKSGIEIKLDIVIIKKFSQMY